ncbi:hypothetical protein GGX14DRAFT_481481 [Mycena pura]|uniref:Uncharacterized protein n=1 Tax=Mycena pura TaxID=153505 RepID=A0AAD6USW4_9AGAR|nr:hypothetical protein GGX14DRAFT_481481 [Mycena pura]
MFAYLRRRQVRRQLWWGRPRLSQCVPSPFSFLCSDDKTTQGSPIPATNATNQSICRQCGLPGCYKEGKCVEKWVPLGPGAVCEMPAAGAAR